MKDFNFFSSYIKQKKLANRKIKIIATVVSVFVLVIAGSYVATELMMLALRVDIADMKKYLASGEVAEKKQLLELKKRQIDLVKNYIAMVDSAFVSLDNISVIKSSLMEELNKTLPQSVYFKNMTFSSTKINMIGSAASRTAVAELYHNLVALNIFQEVYIGSIQTDETTQEYTFDIQGVLKDVINP